MAFATISEASTTTGEATFGRISTKMMRGVETPSTRAASTYSRWRIARNSPLTRRATGGQLTTEIAATIDPILGVKIAIRTTAKTKLGIVWNRSVTRKIGRA